MYSPKKVGRNCFSPLLHLTDTARAIPVRLVNGTGRLNSTRRQGRVALSRTCKLDFSMDSPARTPPYTTSVCSWLKDLPSPTASAAGTKRKHTSIKSTLEQSWKHARKPLAELKLSSARPTENMPDPQASSSRGRPRADPPSTPRRRGRTTRGRIRTNTQRAQGISDEEAGAVFEENEDLEVTPRPAGFGISDVRLKPPKEPTTSSTMSSSPVKMSGLLNVRGGLDYEKVSVWDVVENKNHPLCEIQPILETISDFSQGIGIVPSAMKVAADSIFCLGKRAKLRS